MTPTDEQIDAALDTKLGLDFTLRQLIRGDTMPVGYGKADVVRALLDALVLHGADLSLEQAIDKTNRDIGCAFPGSDRMVILCKHLGTLLAMRERRVAADASGSLLQRLHGLANGWLEARDNRSVTAQTIAACGADLKRMLP